MKKQNIITFLAFFTLFSANVNAIDKYVRDDIDVYLRRGPGSQYAFSNSVKAGDKVTVLENSVDGKYARIQIGNGRIAWIETSKLNDQPSYRELFPSLEAKLAEYKDKVDNADKYRQSIINESNQKLQTNEKLIESLQKKNSELEAQVKEQSKHIDSMMNQVDDKRRDLIVTWFTYGGLVAGGGLILGLILPRIIPSRRKKDRWM